MRLCACTLRMGLRIAVSALVFCLAFAACGFAEMVTQSVIEPTCTEPGYILIEDLQEQTISVENLPALGHAYGEWETDADAAGETRICGVCGYAEHVRISTVSEEKLARLYLYGSMDGIGKKQKVTLEAQFKSPEESFGCYAIMTLQGHSTYGYPKSNYTVRFYDDLNGNGKHKLRFGDWQKEHKYILKANYTDISLCRNIVGARLWQQMIAGRKKLPKRIASLPTYGAVDGFPVAVYLNDAFFGLYTMNLHKDEDLYGMKEGERAALAICNRETTGEALFREKAAFDPDYSSDWEIEYCGVSDEEWAKKSFNKLIDFVMNSSDPAFKKDLSDHLDVNAAMDYLIFIYALGLQHSGAKDLVMLNYGDAWIPSAYDMDEAFGLDADAGAYMAHDAFVPTKTDGIWDSGTGSLLWDRLLTVFETEIRERYAALRKTVLSEENILETVDAFINEMPERFVDMDLNLFAGRPVPDTDGINQIRAYIPERLDTLDKILGGTEQ